MAPGLFSLLFSSWIFYPIFQNPSKTPVGHTQDGERIVHLYMIAGRSGESLAYESWKVLYHRFTKALTDPRKLILWQCIIKQRIKFRMTAGSLRRIRILSKTHLTMIYGQVWRWTNCSPSHTYLFVSSRIKLMYALNTHRSRKIEMTIHKTTWQSQSILSVHFQYCFFKYFILFAFTFLWILENVFGIFQKNMLAVKCGF